MVVLLVAAYIPFNIQYNLTLSAYSQGTFNHFRNIFYLDKQIWYEIGLEMAKTVEEERIVKENCYTSNICKVLKLEWCSIDP